MQTLEKISRSVILVMLLEGLFFGFKKRHLKFSFDIVV